MALLFMDGCDFEARGVAPGQPQGRWDVYPDYQAGQGIEQGGTAGGAIQLESTGRTTITLGNFYETVIVCGWMADRGSNPQWWIQFMDGNTSQCAFVFRHSGPEVSLRPDPSGADLAGPQPSGTGTGMTYFQASVTFSAGAGAYRLVVGGQVFSGTCVTSASGEAQCTAVAFGSTMGGVFLDDVVILDTTGPAPWNAPLPECYITTLHPASDVDVHWTTSGGPDHFACVDDPVTDDTSTYVYATTFQNTTDLYGFENLPDVPERIYAVQATAIGCAPWQYNARVNTVVKSGATQADGYATRISGIVPYTQDVWVEDPATSSAWTVAGVNALVAGVHLQ